ncbi:MAG: ATP-grasp domain-containing protein [Deltaproteobacteria bacterium]|nr:ATP-grasp domain-containing protein [Deltaproteobacteria bacterium]
MQSKPELRVGVLATDPGMDAGLASDVAAVVDALARRGHAAHALKIGPEIAAQLKVLAIERAFLVGPGGGETDGAIQGLLDLLGIPYTGSGVLAAALAGDRLRAKDLFGYRNLSTPPAYAVTRAQAADRAEVAALHRSFAFPTVVKARFGRAALGATVVADLETLNAAVAAVAERADWVLVERWVKGRDVAVAVIEGRVLGVVEHADEAAAGIRARRRYAPAQLPSVRQANLAHIARAAYGALGCRGTASVNFVCADDENDAVLSVDTLPALDENGALRTAAQAAGLGLGDLCEAMLTTARLDHPR